jgi:hypothetical protein
MRMKVKGFTKLVMGLFILFASTALAQWPDDPSVNMALSLTSGQATVPHIAATSDGGCYVSWWDNTPGHYCMYLQRINADGDIMWAPDGMLISDHAQDTWLTDYTLTVDNTDCAILAINDLRAGGDWDVYAYRIDQLGHFLWGPDGLTISDDTYSDAFPQAKVTSDGNVVFAWSDISDAGVIRVRKVDINGHDLWAPSIKEITSIYGVGYPRLAETDADGIILLLLIHQGSQYYNPYYPYAHKYDVSGNDLWGSGGVLISNAATVPIYTYPDIVSDMEGGALSYWYDSRGNVLHVYGQRILAAGTVAWTPNGVVVSTTAGQIQVEPTGFYNATTKELMLFYVNKNTDQTIWGVYGQKIDSTGTRQWTNSGSALVPMSDQERGIVNACRIDNGAIVSYFEKPAGDLTNALVQAIRIDNSGTPVWLPSPVTMCSTLSSKDDLRTCINQFGQMIGAWQDFRSDPDGDIYLQNINSDGSLGPLPNHPEGYIAGLVTGPDESTPLEAVIVTTFDSLDAIIGVDTTNEAGVFGLELATAGTYHESFSRAGYRDTAISDIAIAIGETTHVAVAMQIRAGNCNYVVGDANGNGTFNGLDVTYGVAYFKGGPPPLYECECTSGNTWYVSGDVNASCNFNGLDITFMVAYFKGGPTPNPCPDCPPLF